MPGHALVLLALLSHPFSGFCQVKVQVGTIGNMHSDYTHRTNSTSRTNSTRPSFSNSPQNAEENVNELACDRFDWNLEQPWEYLHSDFENAWHTFGEYYWTPSSHIKKLLENLDVSGNGRTERGLAEVRKAVDIDQVAAYKKEARCTDVNGNTERECVLVQHITGRDFQERLRYAAVYNICAWQRCAVTNGPCAQHLPDSADQIVAQARCVEGTHAYDGSDTGSTLKDAVPEPNTFVPPCNLAPYGSSRPFHERYTPTRG